MNDVILTALISGLCVAVPSIMATILSNKENNKLTTYRIDQLTEEVKKHNGIIERVFKLEQISAVREEEIKIANHRIDDLERKVG